MRIGELAAKTGVTAKTIRYYEAIGLLPAPPRSAAGYREYSKDAVTRLGFVRAAASLGLSLGEIREVLAFRNRGEPPCAHVRQLIERHVAALDERIRALTAMRASLQPLARRAQQACLETPSDTAFCPIIEG
jgi:DNA-binding transcriptional MerR regulator